MEIILDQIIDLLDMNQLNVTQVNELLETCLHTITDANQIIVLTRKQNVIENRMRIISETLQRGQVALLAFERLRPTVERFYITHPQ